MTLGMDGLACLADASHSQDARGRASECYISAKRGDLGGNKLRQQESHSLILHRHPSHRMSPSQADESTLPSPTLVLVATITRASLIPPTQPASSQRHGERAGGRRIDGGDSGDSSDGMMHTCQSAPRSSAARRTCFLSTKILARNAKLQNGDPGRAHEMIERPAKRYQRTA